MSQYSPKLHMRDVCWAIRRMCIHPNTMIDSQMPVSGGNIVQYSCLGMALSHEEGIRKLQHYVILNLLCAPYPFHKFGTLVLNNRMQDRAKAIRLL
ncbi:hypothetical protein AVEN_3142-1 [Araneus ventricosus]|uniref:Uncharacterized protein n=1 Tax=Araneus ventricosus TaxID=182803 RepID=A0A4Y2P7S1_ARAVE|nr:hypothetical protein AVEN_3142-1 [Araneus ventricosus]